MLPSVKLWLPADTLASATVPVPLKLRFSPATTLPKVSAALEILSVPSYTREPVRLTVRAVMLALCVPVAKL